MTDWLPFVERCVLLLVLFLSGCAESALLKRRDVPCLTWSTTALMLSGWIAHPLTPGRITAAVLTFLLLEYAIYRYYRQGERPSPIVRPTSASATEHGERKSRSRRP
jgi:hypothetical protein